nr:hypothetical protein [Tanacetum cinerariifolium]
MENEHELSYETLTRVYLRSYEHYKSVGADAELLEPGIFFEQRISAIKGHRGEKLWDELYRLETSMEDVEGCLWCRGLLGVKGRDVAILKIKRWIVVLLLAWDRVFKIKDAFGNKQYKPKDIQELFRKLFNDVQNIHEELDEYINTPSWNRPAFYNNGKDDDEDYAIAITPDFMITDSLIMGDEHLDTIPEKESDEFVKSMLRPLSQIQIDSLLAEFAGELIIFLKSIPPGIDEADCDPEEDIHLVERLLYDNSSPRPPKEFISDNFDTEIESFSPSPILVKDSDSFMKEIDLTITPDDPMLPGIEEDDDDSERDILILEELFDNSSLSLPVIESYHFDILSFSRHPTKPSDGNTGILNIKMIGDISEQKYTCERCGNDLLNRFCSLCNSKNSCVYDPNPNSFDCPPDSCHPSHPIYETYSGDSCGNDSHFGYDCLPRFPLNYEPEPGYIQNYNSYPHDSSSFLQQYLCCDNCRGLYETFQCQPMNQNFYNSNSSGFNQTQPPQFPVIHPPPQETSIEILHDQENAINYVQTFLRKFNRYSFFETPNVLLLAWDRVFKIKDAFGNKQYKPKDIQELFHKLFNDVQNIHEELDKYINTPSWNRPAFYNNGEDDDEDYAIAIKPNFLITDSLIMGDERLDTIPEKESDEFIKSSVETLVPNPSDDDESSHEEVIHEMSFKTYSNPLFDLDEEIISSEFNLIHNEDLDSTPKNDRFDTKSYLLESLLNHATLMASSLKIDSLLVEFVGELIIFLKSIPPGIDEADCDPEEDIHLVERLLYDNSSPRPPKEFVSDNSDTEIESFSPSPIPVKDSDSFMEEIDLTFTPDDPMLPGIEEDDDDSERDILILEELFDNSSLPLPAIESYHFDILAFSHPPTKPSDGNTGILNIKMIGDISEQKFLMPGLMIALVPNQEKSPDLLSHRGLEIF